MYQIYFIYLFIYTEKFQEIVNEIKEIKYLQANNLEKNNMINDGILLANTTTTANSILALEKSQSESLAYLSDKLSKLQGELNAVQTQYTTSSDYSENQFRKIETTIKSLNDQVNLVEEKSNRNQISLRELYDNQVLYICCYYNNYYLLL